MPKPEIRLLIAEDEEAIRNSIASYIRKHTTLVDQVYTAENGQEALDILFRYRPQILLLDIHMPVKDGIAVMKEAAAAGVTPYTIILSGYGEFEFAQQALRFGAVDYLLKPCRSTEIVKRIDALVRQELLEAEPVEPDAAEEAAAGNRFVQEATAYMQEHYPDELTLTSVAEKIGITASYLSTLFTRTLGYGFAECLNRIRVEKACDYFYDNRMKTYEVAFKVGFKDEKYFSSVFKKMMGKSPSEYKKTLHSTDS